jgi:oligosaccharide translocation protein RFT1
VAWLTIPFGLCLTIISLFFHLHQCSRNKSSDYDYKIAGVYFCIATAIEIISEPCLIHCLRTFNVTGRAKAEGIASIGKALTTVFLLCTIQNQNDNDDDESPFDIHRFIGPVSTFGIAQIIYAIILSTILHHETKSELYIPSLRTPRQESSSEETMSNISIFDYEALKLSITFSIQSIFKHLLTEGDRIILSTLVSSYNAGIYALVSSYGSIVSRMILLPLEENGRLLFSHYHGQIIAAQKVKHSIDKSSSSSCCSSSCSRSCSSSSPTRQNDLSLIQQLETTYIALVKLVLYIGLFFITFGTNYTATLLQILAGRKWGNKKQAYQTLSTYCSYILCMSWNGMTEAFVYGVVDDSVDVGLLSIMHGLIGFIFYVIAPWLVLRQHDINGTIGLIIANEICMILRSLYSMNFAAHYFDTKRRNNKTTASQDNKFVNMNNQFSISRMLAQSRSFYQMLVKVLPPMPIMICFAMSYKATGVSKSYFLEESGEEESIALFSIQTLMHIAVGVSFLLLMLTMVFLYEKEYGRTLKRMISSKQNGSKEKSE